MRAQFYELRGDVENASKYFKLAKQRRLTGYNLQTMENYKKMRKILRERTIQLICVQYPVRSIEPLKKMLQPHEDIIFVDNEKIFKKAIQQEVYDEYFIDIFAGDFGHCTEKGNKLLAENIADVISREYFHK